MTDTHPATEAEEARQLTRGQLHDQRRSTVISLLVDGDTDPRTAAELVDSLCAVVPAPQVAPAMTRTGPYDFNRGDAGSYAAGLRVIADAIEAGHLPLPTASPVTVYLRGEDTRAALRAAMRALRGGRWVKDPSDTSLYMLGAVGGVPVNLVVPREDVCERVVIGREEVEVPAREATYIPAQEARTEVREVVRWDCGPILGDDVPDLAASADALPPF